MSKSLSNISEEATEETNTAGTLTPILTVTAGDGTKLILDALGSRRGSESGIPIRGKLRSAQGTQMPRDTSFGLAYKGPTDDDFSLVSELWDNIEDIRLLTLTEQTDEEYIDALKVKVKGGNEIHITDNGTFAVVVNSSAVIDWTYSRLSFNENAVREVSD
jgi:hypothetical protein